MQLTQTERFVIELAFTAFVLFVIGGFTWQALDEETFPTKDLEPWFAKLFRR